MRRSHSVQLLASITVFLVIALAIIFNVYYLQGREYNGIIQELSLVSIVALGGSFLGTTVFWLFFECDFSNRKRLRKMDDRIKKTESIERINQEVIDEIREDIHLVAKTQRRIESNQEEQKRWQKRWQNEQSKELDSNKEPEKPEESNEPEPKSNKKP